MCMLNPDFVLASKRAAEKAVGRSLDPKEEETFVNELAANIAKLVVYGKLDPYRHEHCTSCQYGMCLASPEPFPCPSKGDKALCVKHRW